MSLCRLGYCRRPRKNVIGEKCAKGNSPGYEEKVDKAAIFAMANNHGNTRDGGCNKGDECGEMTAYNNDRTDRAVWLSAGKCVENEKCNRSPSNSKTDESNRQGNADGSHCVTSNENELSDRWRVRAGQTLGMLSYN